MQNYVGESVIIYYHNYLFLYSTCSIVSIMSFKISIPSVSNPKVYPFWPHPSCACYPIATAGLYEAGTQTKDLTGSDQ